MIRNFRRAGKTNRSGKRLSFARRDKLLLLKAHGFLEKRSNVHNANHFYCLFSGILAFLTRGWAKQMVNQPIEKVFQRALKSKGIKRVVEIGSGGNSFLEKLATDFRAAGTKMFVIEKDLEEAEYQSLKKSGINAARRFAGKPNLPIRSNFDLIIAQDVFSFGGSEIKIGAGDKSKVIKEATTGTIDLIKMLSNNKNASIILAETKDALCVDREAIEKHARILKWEQWKTENSIFIRGQNYIEDELKLGFINPHEAKVLREAPNLIVLQKK